jgi:hypothetical protein
MQSKTVTMITIRSFEHSCRTFIRTVCAGLLLFMLPAHAATQIPLSTTLKFGSDRFVEFPVSVTRNRYYQIDLVFKFETAEQRIAAKKLAGEPTRICKRLNECGVTPTFVLTIKRGADILLREERTPVGTYAFGSNGFYRLILKTPLKPADYDVRVEVTYVPVELVDYEALIEFTTDPRSSDLEN